MIKENKLNYSVLNNAQGQAVKCINGASLIIAGAGSGKTRVLTYKIAYMLDQGVEPNNILALTFTNKAAKEMKERISDLVGRDKAIRLWMGTFHSIFIRFLREYSKLINFPASFTIYDQSDSRSAIKRCIKELQLDDKIYKPKAVLSRISRAKNNLITNAAYMNNISIIQDDISVKMGRICDIYKLYAEKCQRAGAMDFDDVLLFMNILLKRNKNVCEELGNRFKYILVDEYQDTNLAQYYIVKRLSQVHGNISVVGDDSQSIYSFRGARIRNILNFKKDYPDAKEFKLEQNYRSTSNIVEAANSVIKKNVNRIEKKCFSLIDAGDKIGVISAYNDLDEANRVISSIIDNINNHQLSYDHFAILYRTNAQSRVIEEVLRKKNLPYKIYKGHSFYERAEIKDVLAYFRLCINHKDDEAFRRIINTPARGIGATTIKSLDNVAKEKSISLWEVCSKENIEATGLKVAYANKVLGFVKLIADFEDKVQDTDAYDCALEIINTSLYYSFLNSDNSIEGQSRLNNVKELLDSVKVFVETETESEGELGNENKIIPLVSFIENVALLTDMDTTDEEDTNKINLMTVHSSKGLEYSYVYIIGMEEKLFPSLSGMESETEIEEERRLFYVALTRAKIKAIVSYCKSRFKFGEYVSYPPSRFIKEIDNKFLESPILNTKESEAESFRKSIDTSNSRSYSRYNNSSRYNYSSKKSKNTFPNPNPTFTPNPNFKRVSKVITSSVSNNSGTIGDYSVGKKVEHSRFGEGVITELVGSPVEKATVEFKTAGKKVLLLKFAKLKIIN
ncbi:MAG: UvrD-helicase domain-containing protein [Bacteroidales bacterium]